MNVQVRGHAFAALMVLAFAAAACGNSASSGGAGSPAGSPAGGTATGGISDRSYPAAGGGSCSVTVSGDVTASWQRKQDASSLMVTYWLSESEREFLDMTAGEESFLLNCQSDKGTISLYNTSGTTAAQFPQAPKSYVIASGGILGGGEPGQISMLVTLQDTSSIWKVSEAGTFEVTTFTGSKFAGTFQAKVAKVGDDLKTVVATATVSGTFDFDCTSGGCG